MPDSFESIKTPGHVEMTGPDASKSGTGKPVKVKTVVKDYLDTLLGDVFPDVTLDSEKIDELTTDLSPQTHDSDLAEEGIPEENPNQETQTAHISEPDLQLGQKLEDSSNLQVSEDLTEPLLDSEVETTETSAIETPEPTVPEVAAPAIEPVIETLETPAVAEPEPKKNNDDSANTLDSSEITEPELETQLQYPQAPPWAQESFDILLFNVCGLKLAVCMEALGRIIKVEHETTQIIGKPDWFIGAYHESEQHLYVVDTAKFIMPEKGFDLAKLGFEYIIQLQRSDWTLACKEVYKTIRINPDQVKWRSQKGKRQWLAGTVIEHMCALVHVDSLIDLLKEQAS